MFHKNKVCNETFIHMLGARSYRCAVDSDSLATVKEWSIEKPCSVATEFKDLAVLVMEKDNIDAPCNTDNALKLYQHLKHVLDC